MPNSLHILFKLVITLILSSLMPACTSTASKTILINRHVGFAPLLVITPVSSLKKLNETSKKLGAYIFSEISTISEVNAINSDQLPQLSKKINNKSLKRNGSLSIQEITAIGRLASCKTAIAIDLIDLSPYPPQNIKANVLFIKILDGSIISRFNININLDDTNTKKQYSKFLGINMIEKIYKKSSLDDKDKLHAAMLNSDLFQKFAANYIKNQIFTNK